MRFSEAEQRYRELEEQLMRGELTEEEFPLLVAQLRVVDEQGHRWMISARSGRWLMHDGQEWVFAKPPQEGAGAEPVSQEPTALVPVGAGAPAVVQGQEVRAAGLRPRVSRWLLTGLASLVLIACIIGVGAAGWVFFLRNLGESTPIPTGEVEVGMVETYTPRPATPTYTPTFTPTPSRTPTPTTTPVPTDAPTLVPTFTPLPPTATYTAAPTASPTSSPTAAPSSTATAAPPSGQTYVVQRGDTLSAIAARFKVSVQALAAANGIADPALIWPGQTLVIPVPGTTPLPPTTAATPTWTPIILTPRTPAATPTAGTPARATATSTPKATATPKPPVLSGKIAFTIWNPTVNSGQYDLYVSRIDGSGRNLLGQGFRQPQFRQDGNMLAVNGEGAHNYEHLVIMNPSGGDWREISNFSEDSYPTWSPDGNLVAFSSSAWGDGRILLGIVQDMYGKKQKWIPFGSTELEGQFPFWLADGRIVFHGCDFWGGNTGCGLKIVGSGGGTPLPVTSDQSDTAPAGFQARVAFMSARDGNWEVYTVNADGSSLKRLTKNGARDGLPTWSPDGKSIAFVSDRSGAWAIWVMKADGSSQRKLFDLGGEYGTGDRDWTTERISWAP